MAYKYNIEEIQKTTESSRLFMGYLQLDSYILTNHLIKEEKSYSLSIEPLFIIKNHLLQAYEGFFLIGNSNNNRFAQSITDEKITTININKIFEFSNILSLEAFDKIEKPHILKNHAFAVSMEFRNENNSHHKKNKKNIHITSPIYYFDKENIKKIMYDKNKKIHGEDGRLIEVLIDEDRDIILSLKADIIYGNLLDTKFFIQKDFEELKKEMNKIRKMKDKFNDKKDEPKINNNQIKEDLNTKEENQNENKDLERIYREMKRIGTIEISDEEYTEYLIKEIIKTAKRTNTYEQLPEVIKYIDRRMEEEKK